MNKQIDHLSFPKPITIAAGKSRVGTYDLPSRESARVVYLRLNQKITRIDLVCPEQTKRPLAVTARTGFKLSFAANQIDCLHKYPEEDSNLYHLTENQTCCLLHYRGVSPVFTGG